MSTWASFCSGAAVAQDGLPKPWPKCANDFGWWQMDANGPMSRENTIGFPVFLFFRSYVKLQPGQRSGVIVSSCLFAHAFQYFWLLSSSCFSHYSFLSDIWNNPTKFNEKREPEIPWFPSKMGKKKATLFLGVNSLNFPNAARQSSHPKVCS